jgi:hypothetical protein
MADFPEAGKLPNIAVAEKDDGAASLVAAQSDATAAPPVVAAPAAVGFPAWAQWSLIGLAAWWLLRRRGRSRGLGWDPDPIPMSPREREIVGMKELTPKQMEDVYESMRRTHPERTSFTSHELKGRWLALHPRRARR